MVFRKKTGGGLIKLGDWAAEIADYPSSDEMRWLDKVDYASFVENLLLRDQLRQYNILNHSV